MAPVDTIIGMSRRALQVVVSAAAFAFVAQDFSLPCIGAGVTGRGGNRHSRSRRSKRTRPASRECLWRHSPVGDHRDECAWVCSSATRSASGIAARRLARLGHIRALRHHGQGGAGHRADDQKPSPHQLMLQSLLEERSISKRTPKHAIFRGTRSSSRVLTENSVRR